MVGSCAHISEKKNQMLFESRWVTNISKCRFFFSYRFYWMLPKDHCGLPT